MRGGMRGGGGGWARAVPVGYRRGIRGGAGPSGAADGEMGSGAERRSGPRSVGPTRVPPAPPPPPEVPVGPVAPCCCRAVPLPAAPNPSPPSLSSAGCDAAAAAASRGVFASPQPDNGTPGATGHSRGPTPGSCPSRGAGMLSCCGPWGCGAAQREPPRQEEGKPIERGAAGSGGGCGWCRPYGAPR